MAYLLSPKNLSPPLGPPGPGSFWLLHQDRVFPSSRSTMPSDWLQDYLCSVFVLKQTKKTVRVAKTTQHTYCWRLKPKPQRICQKGIFPMPLPFGASQTARAAMTFQSSAFFITAKALPSPLRYKVSVRVYITKLCLALSRWISQNEKEWMTGPNLVI